MKNELPEFAQDEAQAAIDKLKKVKQVTTTESGPTKEMIRQIFNEVLKQDDCTPETWRRIRIRVIYKKEMWKKFRNYRPIRTLPALYKLFSTIIYNRLYSSLDQAQSEDQGGFRRS